jgi:hypothetical protein
MKRSAAALALLLCVTSVQAADTTASAPVAAPVAIVAATPTAAVTAAAAPASAAVVAPTMQGFPLTIKGTEVLFDLTSDRADLSAKLKKILGENTPMDEKNRLQWDFSIDSAQAPMTLIVDWDEKGSIVEIALDAFMEEQNPPAKELKAWLIKNAGPGKADKSLPELRENISWEYNGWNFLFQDGGDGEDSAYAFRITPLPTK